MVTENDEFASGGSDCSSIGTRRVASTSPVVPTTVTSATIPSAGRSLLFLMMPDTVSTPFSRCGCMVTSSSAGVCARAGAAAPRSAASITSAAAMMATVTAPKPIPIFASGFSGCGIDTSTCCRCSSPRGGSMVAASAATRASERRRASRAVRHATAAHAAAITPDIAASTNSIIVLHSSDGSSQFEFDGNFDDDVHGFALTPSRRKLPLPDRGNGLLIEPLSKPAQHGDVPDPAVAGDDDLEQDVARHPFPARLFGVVGLDLAQQARRLNAAAGSIRSTAGAAAGTLAEARPDAIADSLPLAATGPATCACPFAADLCRSGLYDAYSVP